MSYLDDHLAQINQDMADALEVDTESDVARLRAATIAELDLESHHDGIGEPHTHSTPQIPGPDDAANCPSDGPGPKPAPAKGEEPTPGSAAATATAARESTGAVVAPGAGEIVDPSPGSGAPVSPSVRGVGPSLQVGTAWLGPADVRRVPRS